MAGFLFEILQSDDGRRSTPQLATLAGALRARRCPSLQSHIKLAGLREHAGLAARTVTRRTRPRRIRLAPHMICASTCDHAHFPFGEKPMTAYLISLALVGLVVIAFSEEFS